MTVNSFGSMYTFFHLDKDINVDKLLKLRVNPFNMNSPNQNFNVENILSDDDCNTLYVNNCKYICCDNFNTQYKDKKSNISMLHLNARSLPRNFNEFQVLLSSIDYDFSFIGNSQKHGLSLLLILVCSI